MGQLVHGPWLQPDHHQDGPVAPGERLRIPDEAGRRWWLVVASACIVLGLVVVGLVLALRGHR